MGEADERGPADGKAHRGLARAEALLAALPLTADEWRFVVEVG